MFIVAIKRVTFWRTSVGTRSQDDVKCCQRLLNGFSSVGFIFILEFLGLLLQIETVSGVRAVLRAFRPNSQFWVFFPQLLSR